jgi:hypothetical protein
MVPHSQFCFPNYAFGRRATFCQLFARLLAASSCSSSALLHSAFDAQHPTFETAFCFLCSLRYLFVGSLLIPALRQIPTSFLAGKPNCALNCLSRHGLGPFTGIDSAQKSKKAVHFRPDLGVVCHNLSALNCSFGLQIVAIHGPEPGLTPSLGSLTLNLEVGRRRVRFRLRFSHF